MPELRRVPSGRRFIDVKLFSGKSANRWIRVGFQSNDTPSQRRCGEFHWNFQFNFIRFISKVVFGPPESRCQYCMVTSFSWGWRANLRRLLVSVEFQDIWLILTYGPPICQSIQNGTMWRRKRQMFWKRAWGHIGHYHSVRRKERTWSAKLSRNCSRCHQKLRHIGDASLFCCGLITITIG